ncbi:MAG: CDP-alcohol phosphatidyltransferase family protein [Myxococcales bacterium]|nr:CDP-alcohol phosphatidyltransferase family protein [Myxococcales bacterium]MCB9734264.1 CDP-alcohol phosphatidyltransferase family protein [Deltaproteobacteria bacterium]
MNGIIVVPRESAAEPGLWTRTTGGVGYLKRQARLLRAVGVTRLLVVGDDRVRDALESVAVGRLAVIDDVRVVAIPTDAGTEAARAAVLTAMTGADGPTVVLDARYVLERGAMKKVAARDPGAGVEVATAGGEAIGLAVVGRDGLAAAVDRALAGEIEVPAGATRFELGASDLVGRVTDAASHAKTEHALWERCRKVVDGFVSRNLNRHISLFISRRIATSPITPNHVSSFTLVLGLVGAFCAWHGTYWWVLAGAFLLKANSVLDGVDGELARMRIQSSVLGEWLDTISDDLSNQSFFLAVGFGAAHVTGDALWLWLGVASVVPLFLTSAQYYFWLVKLGRGDVLVFDWFKTEARTAEELARRSGKERFMDLVTQLFRRDAFVMMLLVMAVFGVVQYALFVVAPAAWATFLAVLLRTLRGDMVKSQAGAGPGPKVA